MLSSLEDEMNNLFWRFDSPKKMKFMLIHFSVTIVRKENEGNFARHFDASCRFLKVPFCRNLPYPHERMTD